MNFAFFARRIGVAVVISAAILTPPSTATAAADDRITSQPNFVIILADDLGYNDLGCFGSEFIKTPHLDKMAEEGARFTDFYTAPSCTTSRAALMTGSIPVRVGFGDQLQNVNGRYSPSQVVHPNSPYGLNPDEVTLPEVLKEAGYFTSLVGKWHLGDAPKFHPLKHGFDHYFGVPYSNDMDNYFLMDGTEIIEQSPSDDEITGRLTTEAIKVIRENKDKPFFLYLAHVMPHTPLGASEQFKGKSERGAYGDAVEELDWSVGQVLATLKELNLDDNTLVVFFSDNGPWLRRGANGGIATPLRAGKGTTYEGGMRVPCIMRWPGVVPAGTTCLEVASNMDFLPTFARLANFDFQPSNIIDGKDITELIREPETAKSPYEAFYYYFGEQLHAVRSGRWKLRVENNLRNENVYRRDLTPEQELTPMPEVLYDLVFDPGEQKDVIRNHPKIAERLRGYIEEARQDVGDSLTGIKGKNLRPVGLRDGVEANP